MIWRIAAWHIWHDSGPQQWNGRIVSHSDLTIKLFVPPTQNLTLFIAHYYQIWIREAFTRAFHHHVHEVFLPILSNFAIFISQMSSSLAIRLGGWLAIIKSSPYLCCNLNGWTHGSFSSIIGCLTSSFLRLKPTNICPIKLASPALIGFLLTIKDLTNNIFKTVFRLLWFGER